MGSDKQSLKHQNPGSKIHLCWDENGDEWIVDAYIHKYVTQTEKILNLLDSIEKQGGHILLKPLSQSRSKLRSLLADKLNINHKTIKKMDLELDKILGGMKHLLDYDFEIIKDLIDYNLKLSKKSINENSKAAVHGEANIELKPTTKEENIAIKAFAITAPTQRLVKHITHIEVRQSALTLMMELHTCVANNLLEERSCENEKKLAGLVENILQTLLDIKLSDNDKLRAISKFNQKMKNTFSKMIVGSAGLTGVLEGVDAATRMGGWMGVKHLPYLISSHAQEKQQRLAQLSKSIDLFITACSSRLANNY